MPGNPWLDDEPTSNSRNTWDPNKDYLQEHVQKQKQTLESQQRALRLLAESEQVGADTAVELKRQGEVLDRAEQKVDNINENLNVAEYHVRTIKSWFGGITNKFRKKPPGSEGQGQQGESVTSQNIAAAQENNQNAQHVARQINPGTSGQSSSSAAAINSTNNNNNNRQHINTNKPMTQFDLMENQIGSNLDQMSMGLGRLKDLGMGLNDELQKQNNQLERLNGKMSKVDERTSNVNGVLRRLNN